MFAFERTTPGHEWRAQTGSFLFTIYKLFRFVCSCVDISRSCLISTINYEVIYSPDYDINYIQTVMLSPPQCSWLSSLETTLRRSRPEECLVFFFYYIFNFALEQLKLLFIISFILSRLNKTNSEGGQGYARQKTLRGKDRAVLWVRIRSDLIDRANGCRFMSVAWPCVAVWALSRSPVRSIVSECVCVLVIKDIVCVSVP